MICDAVVTPRRAVTTRDARHDIARPAESPSINHNNYQTCLQTPRRQWPLTMDPLWRRRVADTADNEQRCAVHRICTGIIHGAIPMPADRCVSDFVDDKRRAVGAETAAARRRSSRRSFCHWSPRLNMPELTGWRVDHITLTGAADCG